MQKTRRKNTYMDRPCKPFKWTRTHMHGRENIDPASLPSLHVSLPTPKKVLQVSSLPSFFSLFSSSPVPARLPSLHFGLVGIRHFLHPLPRLHRLPLSPREHTTLIGSEIKIRNGLLLRKLQDLRARVSGGDDQLPHRASHNVAVTSKRFKLEVRYVPVIDHFLQGRHSHKGHLGGTNPRRRGVHRVVAQEGRLSWTLRLLLSLGVHARGGRHGCVYRLSGHHRLRGRRGGGRGHLWLEHQSLAQAFSQHSTCRRALSGKQREVVCPQGESGSGRNDKGPSKAAHCFKKLKVEEETAKEHKA
mmetsp:Transcript_12830/g.25078  ORF Transcript_12830/g.25078 Transcript_12830/m.25078 type:complete len:302 (+) Transcript_12830:508-1413(+)